MSGISSSHRISLSICGVEARGKSFILGGVSYIQFAARLETTHIYTLFVFFIIDTLVRHGPIPDLDYVFVSLQPTFG